MAAAMSISSPTIDLDDVVSCSVCLENFDDARALPCVHSYCKNCLQELMTQQQTITCPQCRQEFNVPNGDVSNFPRNYNLNNIVQHLHLTHGSSPVSINDRMTVNYCPKHPEKTLELFCRDCFCLICYKCASNRGTCSQHSYDGIQEIFDECRLNIEDLLRKNDEILPCVVKHGAALTNLKEYQSINLLEVTEQITEMFEKHIESLKSRQASHIQKAFDLHEQNSRDLTIEVDRIKFEETKIRSAVFWCYNILDLTDPTEFLQKYIEFKDEMVNHNTHNDLVSQFDLESLRFQAASDSLLADVISNFGNVKIASDKKETCEVETPHLQQRLPIIDVPESERPAIQRTQSESAVNRQEGKTRNHSWKLQNSNSRFNPHLAFDDPFSIRSSSQRSVSLIGKPGFQHGKHSWKFSITGFPNGFGIGVTIGEHGQALTVMFDSRFETTRSIFAQLDCEAKKLSVLPENCQQPNVLCFENGQNREIYPYFYLSPCNGKTDGNCIKITSIDGVEIKNDSSCSIL